MLVPLHVVNDGGVLTHDQLIMESAKTSDVDPLIRDHLTTLLSKNHLVPPNFTFEVNRLDELDAPEGTVKLTSQFYVQRRNESKWLSHVLRWGETIRVKGAHQMGKSSLLARMYQQTKENGRASFYLDMQRLDTDAFLTLDTLLRSMAELIAIRLRTNNSPHMYWIGPLGSKDKLSEFLLVEVLEKASLPVLFILDNVDIVFNYPYRDDFFSLIRSWHNERALEDAWRKLNIVLSYSTEAYLFIRDLNQSPFNVGVLIELTDFNRSEIEYLNLRHNSLIKEPEELEGLVQLLGGHPYLWRVALYVMTTQDMSVSQLITTAYDDDGPFAEHLRRYLRQLECLPILRASMKEILSHNTCTDNESFYRLRAAGVVLGHSPTSVRPRCNLYARYFGVRL